MKSVIHFEIPVDDMERAKEFYSNVFGWSIDPVPDMEYSMLITSKMDESRKHVEYGRINGGMMKRNKIKNTVVTIGVESIDEALEEIRENGGSTVMGKTEVMGMGYSAYFKDSEGNIVGLWEEVKKQG